MKKTIALTMIVKDEIRNLGNLFKSVHGCFDKAYITDTGSTDGTLEYLQSEEAKKEIGCEIEIFHFKWIDDFSAARNFNLNSIKEDYWCWMDADDTLMNKDAFLSFKDTVLSTSEAWYLPYHYHLDENGNPRTSFIRERIIKTDLNVKFVEFIHEGIDLRLAGRPVSAQMIGSFAIKHMRTQIEADADKGRNLRLLEARKDNLSPRLKFYYGKELADVERFKEAKDVLKDVVKGGLEDGDKIMALQYLCNTLNVLGEYSEAIKYGIISIQTFPQRAEYYCLVADSYLKLGQHHHAIPFFGAAKYCINSAANGMSHEFSDANAYQLVPRMNLAHHFFLNGSFEKALEEILPVKDANQDTQNLFKEIDKALKAVTIRTDVIDCDDIVITCPNPNAYEWDEDKYKTSGLGGSETAAVEMAIWLKKLTGRCVKIFQHRKGTYVSPSGVEYIGIQHIHDYFNKWNPALHIAWRHSCRFTNAETVVWSHDLCTPDGHMHENYDFMFALSSFHKNYIKGMQGVPEDKILLTSNGINPDRFKNLEIKKQYGKVIWPNSPDRGLEFAILTMDLVRKEIPDAELHCFYGLENLEKYGLKAKADELREMMKSRPWVKYIGNVTQDRLAQEFASSSVWLYTANFLETFCITALEALSCKAWPVIRKFGALEDTMKEAIDKNWCDLLDVDMNDKSVPLFAERVISAIKEEKWKEIDFNPDKYSWQAVAKHWIKLFNLN